ncbi:2-(3-amino-3-carboxypropyl)histidine synthase subunit 2 isoform X2 [Daktulosphaira vitifoliae]|uniref:2-(3-amino-3-carboxypropyl)histidine synthase subunit 2 isoform X2 n=1 Tax=Daktulosphaira vitifoliae TaxID=58002 RepID=UPI0021AAF5BC|nr:2-(3-amino-3-carboxypropyl)histidine synthase subunit 2 isoform X2 [Daktulosphaira vitifoliae]
MDQYKNEIEKCVDWIKQGNYETVCIQLPDNMLHISVEISLEFEKLLGFRVYILGDTSYGSCCVDETAAQHVNADCVIHFGRACLTPTSCLPVYYILPKQNLDIQKCSTIILEQFSSIDEPILVLYDVVYHHLRNYLVESLASIKSIVISNLDLPHSEENKDVVKLFGRQFSDCNYKYIIYLTFDNYMNNVNRFILNKQGSEVYLYKNNFDVLIEESLSKVIKQKYYIHEKIKDCTHIGILICSLSMKGLMDHIKKVKSLCKAHNKKSYIFSVGRPNVAKLANFPEVQIFVNITCSEGVIENKKEFMQLIVGIEDIEVALFQENTDIPDVSLVSNKLRNIQSLSENLTASSALTSRSDMSLSLTTQNRTWIGLNPLDNRPPIALAAEGRKGTPSTGYTTQNSNFHS